MVSPQIQGEIFLYSAIAGIFVGLAYDFYRVLRIRLNIKKLGTYIGDAIFWPTITIIVFFMLLLINQGEMRFFVFLGLLSGIVVYFHLLTRPAFRCIDFLFYLTGKMEDLIFTLLGYLYILITMPFRTFWLVLVWPIGISVSGCRYLNRYTAESKKVINYHLTAFLRQRVAAVKYFFDRKRKE